MTDKVTPVNKRSITLEAVCLMQSNIQDCSTTAAFSKVVNMLKMSGVTHIRFPEGELTLEEFKAKL